MPFVPDTSASSGRFVPDGGAPKVPTDTREELGLPPAAPGAAPAPGGSGAPSLGDRAKGGAEAALSVGTSMVGGAAGNLVGFVRALTSGKFGTDEAMREGAKAAGLTADALTYEPRSQSGKDSLHTVGKILEESKIQGMDPALPIRAAGGNTPRTVGRAIAESPEGNAIAGGARAVKSALRPEIAPDKAALARKAQEIGIDLRPDMLSDNKIVRMIGEALEKVPLSGSKAEQRQVAFNRAVMKELGVDTRTASATRLTPDVFDKAITASGEKIGSIAGSTSVPMSGTPFAEQVSAHVAEAAKFETADVAKVLANYAAELHARAAANGGVIDGATFRKINSKIGRQARTTSNGDLRSALGDFQDSMHDALAGQLSGEDLKAFDEARKQYAIAKTVEPIIAKSKNGDVSPAGLMGAVTSDKSKKSAMARGRGGDLGDLARIGQAFLKEPESSGTTERGIAYGALGGGAFMEPTVAAGIYGAANIYNRVGGAVSRRMVRDVGEKDRATPIRDLEDMK